jgi:hypothetical protein
MDKFLDENGLDEKTIAQWSHEHNRHKNLA